MEIAAYFKYIRFFLLNKIRAIIQFLQFLFEFGTFSREKRYKELETKILSVQLPDPLVLESGEVLSQPKEWFEKRRPEIIQLFQNYMYGKSPFRDLQLSFSVTFVNEHALKDLSTYKEIKIGIENHPDCCFVVSLFIPNIVKKYRIRSPIFVGLNFFGNHTVHSYPHIYITRNWTPDISDALGVPRQLLRGIHSSNWQLEYLIKHGYGLATAYYGDIVPDRQDGLECATSNWFPDINHDQLDKKSWGAIDAWAWQLTKIMDYIQCDKDLDSERVIVIGHSRLGKAALWAGVKDDRFAMVISNESGCCGAALSRFKHGETIAMLNSRYPHWFRQEFKIFNNKEETLPFDQHELIALIAPRPVYIASAQRDLEADPVAEFMSAKAASRVYNFLGMDGLLKTELPPLNIPTMGDIGYHLRRGGHGITRFDWCQFVKFADMHLKENRRIKKYNY